MRQTDRTVKMKDQRRTLLCLYYNVLLLYWQIGVHVRDITDIFEINLR